jgi:hypothetical protein
MQKPEVNIAVPGDPQQMLEALIMAMVRLTNVMRKVAWTNDQPGAGKMPAQTALYLCAENELQFCPPGSIAEVLMKTLCEQLGQDAPKPDLRLVARSDG